MAAPILPILLGAGVVALLALGGKKSTTPSGSPPPTAPPAGGGGGYVAPGIVPPAGIPGAPAIPPEWGLPGGVVVPPTPASGGVPFPGATTGPSTALPDNGIAGLPEPLKSTTVIAMTNAKTVEDANALDGLALELDRMGQHKAAYEVRARSNAVRIASGTTTSGWLRATSAIIPRPTAPAPPRPVALAPYSIEARAYAWGQRSGIDDARANRPYAPDAAVAASDLARDVPASLLLRAIVFLRRGYYDGYMSVTGGR